MTYSKYPGQIDDEVTLPVTVDRVTPVEAEVVNRLRDSIIATETELGTNPSSTYATVAARLTAIESGGGGVSGSGTDNHLVRWNGTDAVQDSGWNLSDDNMVEIPMPTETAEVIKLLAPTGGGGSINLLKVQDAQSGETGTDANWWGANGGDSATGNGGEGGNIGVYAGWGGNSAIDSGGRGANLECESGRGGTGDGAFNYGGYGGDAFFGAERGGNGSNGAGGGWGGYLYVYAGNGGSGDGRWPGWGGQVSFESGAGGASYDAAYEGGPAGYLGIYGGNGGYGYNGADGGDPGDVEVSAGFGGTIQTLGSGAIAAPGGTVYINGGGGGGKYASAGGNVDITGGRGGYTTTGVPSGQGGWILIQGGQGGSSGDGDGGSVQIRGGNKNNSGLLGDVIIGDLYTANVEIGASGNNLGFYGTSGIAKQTVVGAKAGNVALTNLLVALHNLGLIQNNTT